MGKPPQMTAIATRAITDDEAPLQRATPSEPYASAVSCADDGDVCLSRGMATGRGAAQSHTRAAQLQLADSVLVWLSTGRLSAYPHSLGRLSVCLALAGHAPPEAASSFRKSVSKSRKGRFCARFREEGPSRESSLRRGRIRCARRHAPTVSAVSNCGR